MLKNTLVILTILLFGLSFTACTKKAVRPNSVNGPDQSVVENGGNGDRSASGQGINLVTSAKNIVSDIFHAFGKAGKTAKGVSFSKDQAVTAMIIGGAVLLGLVILFQNRPKKYSSNKGKYKG